MLACHAGGPGSIPGRCITSFNFKLKVKWNINWNKYGILKQRPYHIEYTSSRLITAVKQCWAKLVLGWVTAWESLVLLLYFHPIAIDSAIYILVNANNYCNYVLELNNESSSNGHTTLNAPVLV